MSTTCLGPSTLLPDVALAYLLEQAVFSWGPIPNGGAASTVIDVASAQMGDLCQASMNVDLQGMIMSAYVSAPGVVTVILQNPTIGTITLSTTATLSVLVTSIITDY